MRIEEIIWPDFVGEKLARKHKVRQTEVLEVLGGSPHIRFIEEGHREGEDLYAAFGKTEAGRRLIVFFVRKTTGGALIISARDMDPSERKLYAKHASKTKG